MALLCCTSARAQSVPRQATTKQIKPSKQQLRQLILDLQVTALKCDQKTAALARQVFQTVEIYRLRKKRFPNSVAEVQELKGSANLPSEKFPPPCPYNDPTLVSQELRQELINAGNPPSEFCKIIIENDPFISPSFPMSLNNVRLAPATGAPGTIIVKYNANYYLAVWCMGFAGKPIVDEKSQLPLVFFRDFSATFE